MAYVIDGVMPEYMNPGQINNNRNGADNADCKPRNSNIAGYG